MAKFEKSTDNRPGLPDYYFECPGCKCQHGVWTSSANGNHATWSFNGDVDKPTIAPSIKITYPVGQPCRKVLIRSHWSRRYRPRAVRVPTWLDGRLY